MFRSGPPEGHKAAKKLEEISDWMLNAGHVHPDIGAFWMHAKGAYLVVDTGYTAKKYTRDHNTILVDGKGQGKDGSYWNERGYPYKRFDDVKVKKVHLQKEYGYALGDFGSAYPASLGKLSMLFQTILGINRPAHIIAIRL